MLKSRFNNGRYEYEIENGRWVSRQRVHQLRNRKAHRVRVRVTMALRNGTLKRGTCEVCGRPNAQAHHYSYDDAYTIQWLCRKHHSRHPKPRKLGNAPLQPPSEIRGRPKGKWISPEEKIKKNRILYLMGS